MSCNFYIVDDDRSVRKMLMQIIQHNFADAVIQQNDSPWMAVHDILRYQPDLVILDLLMEDMDGIEVAYKLRQGLFKGRIIMLSEVIDKEMVEKAYDAGVDDYISKPINVTEVVRVLQRSFEHMQLKSYVRLMGAPQSNKTATSTCSDTTLIKNKITNVYKDLGIVGESGTEELCFWTIAYFEKTYTHSQNDFNLTELYTWLKNNFPPYQQEPMSLKGIEQRLRRLVITVTENLAHMGIEDFSSFKFEKYSTTLFNFKTIKLEMDFIRNPSLGHAKVDVKRFLDGFISLIE